MERINPVGRPPTYTPDTVVALRTAKTSASLKPNCTRRAIVRALAESPRGRLTLAELDNTLGFDTRKRISALVYAGWLEIVK